MFTILSYHGQASLSRSRFHRFYEYHTSWPISTIPVASFSSLYSLVSSPPLSLLCWPLPFSWCALSNAYFLSSHVGLNSTLLFSIVLHLSACLPSWYLQFSQAFVKEHLNSLSASQLCSPGFTALGLQLYWLGRWTKRASVLYRKRYLCFSRYFPVLWKQSMPSYPCSEFC